MIKGRNFFKSIKYQGKKNQTERRQTSDIRPEAGIPGVKVVAHGDNS